MINYSNIELDKDENIKKLFVNYLYLCSLDKNFVGAFLFSYYDCGYNFDLIKFYDNYNGDTITDSVIIGDNNIQFVNFDKSLLNEFIPEIELNNILFDPYEVIEKSIKNKKEHFKASNSLNFEDKYINEIKKDIKNKQQERLNTDLKVFYSLVNYYSVIIHDEKSNIQQLNRFFQDKLVNEHSELRQLHCDALMEAIKNKNISDDNRFLDEENISLYNKIITKK